MRPFTTGEGLPLRPVDNGPSMDTPLPNLEVSMSLRTLVLASLVVLEAEDRKVPEAKVDPLASLPRYTRGQRYFDPRSLDAVLESPDRKSVV